MALIRAGVVKDALTAKLGSALVFAKIAGAVETNFDLKGAGAGDTVTFTQFELSNTTLQTLAKGDTIITDELGQTQFQVTIEQLALGKTIYDQDIKYNISGGGLETEAEKHLRFGFAQGLDKLVMASLETGAQVEELAALNVNDMLDNIVAKFGEKSFAGEVNAVAIHPTRLSQLRADANFEKGDSYQDKKYGTHEVGRLWGLIPVVWFDRITMDTATSKYNNIVIPNASVLTVVGKDLNVEFDRVAKQKKTDIYGDIFAGVYNSKQGIVFRA